MLIDKNLTYILYHVTRDKNETSKIEVGKKIDEPARSMIVYIPQVKKNGITKKSELKIYKDVENVSEDSIQFYAQTNCLAPVEEVSEIIEKYFSGKKIIYGEFSCGIGSTLRSVLPYCKTAYVTDFALKISIAKKMLEWEYKKHIVNYTALNDKYRLINHLLELKSKGTIFDVIFYDADHENNYPLVFNTLKTMTKILIVHDTNFKAVAEDCSHCLSDILCEQFDDNARTRAYVIDETLIEKACPNK